MVNKFYISFFGRVFSSALSFFIFIFLAKNLSIDVFGMYSLSLAYAAIITLIGFSIIKRSVVRLSSISGIYLSTLYTLTVYTSSFLLVLLMAFHIYGVDDFYLAVFFLAISIGIFDVQQEMNIYYEKHLVFNLNLIFRSVLIFIFIFFTSIDDSSNIYQVLIVISVSYLMIALINMIRFRALFSKVVSKEDIIYIAKFGFPLALSTGMVYVVDFFDRFYISKFLGPKEVGIYSGLYNLAQQVVGVIMIALYTYYWPKLAKKYEKPIHFKQIIYEYYQVFLVFSITMILTSYFFHDFIVENVLGFEFSQDSYVLFLIVLSIVISCAKAYCVDVFFLLRNQTKLIFGISFLSAFINVILNVILIPIYGLTGAAYSTLLTFLLSFFISCFFVTNFKKKINDNDINANI
ncbi:oligosaccharide flippase family protein [Vibrio splendidus]